MQQTMYFEGSVITEWLKQSGHDRDMKLLDDFKFFDSKMWWVAEKGAVINGASIPQAFWSTVGSPFVGDYRRASVLHDVACDKKEQPHKKVHRMFYDAMICDGVSTSKAKLMYQAVRIFGPKWDKQKHLIAPPNFTDISRDIVFENLALDIDELDKYLDKLFP
ncbi:MAG: hypothetical protein HW390_609 [Candidatus Brocadiaceae bacterium]|nr:hypothetical protein [Candidatus Brocadiaceae bacterium]